MDKILHALIFADEAHKGQLDDTGESYFDKHLRHVAGILGAVGCSDDVIAAGILHDTLEDTTVDYPALVKEFGETIANLVLEVTHEGKNDNYGYYFPRLKSRDGIMIKLADRMSNVSRMDAWDEERRKQYLRKTRFWRDGPEDRTR